MAIAILPLYPTVGEETTISFTTSTSATTARYRFTVVPDESALSVAAQAYFVDGAGAYLDTFTPDVPGAYTISADLFRKVRGFSAFDGSPSGAAREEYKETQTAIVYVGGGFDLPVVTAQGHGATLRLVVHNGTVRAATLESPTSEIGRIAALQTTVTAALTALVGIAVSTFAQTETLVEDLRANFGDHLTDTAGHHTGTDTVNTVTRERPYSTKSARTVVNAIYENVMGHFVQGTTGGGWHAGGDDTKNLPIVDKAKDDAAGYVVTCELRRCFELHRVQIAAPASHAGAGDPTNVLSTADELESAVRLYLKELAAQTPSAPSGEQTAALYLMHRFGFKAR